MRVDININKFINYESFHIIFIKSVYVNILYRHVDVEFYLQVRTFKQIYQLCFKELLSK